MSGLSAAPYQRKWRIHTGPVSGCGLMLTSHGAMYLIVVAVRHKRVPEKVGWSNGAVLLALLHLLALPPEEE